MSQIPTLTTERLMLRPFALSDAQIVQELAGERDIAAMTTTIPYPYEDGMAEAWIETHQNTFDQGEEVIFAITRRSDSLLIGAIGISINKQHQLGEMGYWIGKPYWNHGYCTEAAQTLLRYAFDVLHLNRVQARHMTKNPTSGRVMQKAGMQYEGTLRQSLRRWGAYEDAAVYAALRTEYTEENMSTEQNKAIVHRAFDELFNQRHAEVIDELWAKEFIHTPGQQGLDTWKEGMVSTLAVAPPDLHLAIEDMIAEGDKVVVRFTWSFTHTVPFFGAEPTGKYISWTGISINRLRDGKIVEEWANLDSLGLERQLGRIE